MKGDEKKLGKVLSGKKQFVVPAYQRGYSWNTDQWGDIWRPIEDQSRAISRRQRTHPYFIGSVVVHLQSGSELERYDVIDGQQRLTTLITILAALRDIAKERNENDIREELDEAFLRNKFVADEFKLKVLSQENDASDMHAIVFGTGQGKGRVWLAYEYFRQKIVDLSNDGVDLKAIKRTMEDGLMAVEIITEEGDNPHRIFQTLNSTGLGLTEVDKLRSHFFMLLPNDHEKHHKELWKPMEKLLGSNIDRFLLVDLVSQAHGLETTKKEHVYKRWQERLRVKEYDEAEILKELSELCSRAKVFHGMLNPNGTREIDRQVQRLNEWGTSTHHTIAFRILRELHEGRISEAEAVDCLRILESYLVRRMLVGIPTNNLNRLFTSTLSQVSNRQGSLRAALMSSLSEPSKDWPTNQQMLANATVNAFYKTQGNEQRQFVLRRLEESYARDGHVDWNSAKFTIEHFMPQTLNDSWIELLVNEGVDDAVEAHAEAVHQIGNLTLTSLNSKLSNLAQERKQQIISVSPVAISQSMKEAATWGPSAIHKRSIELVEQASKIWIEPTDAIDSEIIEFSVIEQALGELGGGDWTSVSELTELDDRFDEGLVIGFVNSAKVDSSKRVLTPDGLPDLRFEWVVESPKAYYEHLLSLGVLTSLEDKKADDSTYVRAGEMLQRIGEGG